MFDFSSIAILALGAIIFFSRRVFRYLRFLQQEEYSTKRFLLWCINNRVFDCRGSAILIGFTALYVLAPSLATLSGLAVALLLASVAFREEDPRRSGKITLKMTQRAKRILVCAYLVFLGVLLCGIFCLYSAFSFALFLIVLIQLIPIILAAAVILLSPWEAAIQRRLINEARAKFAQANLFTVGITGSYGKTSTKAILGRLLNEACGPCFWPEKGINTLMGITREIREKLSPIHKLAVIEMGAYHKGSIRRLCEFTPPQAGIVTAVGIMHLERFGSPEQVYQAKSELAQAVPDSGILVCNGDNGGSRRMAKEFPKAKTFLYGLNNDQADLDCWISDVDYGLKGSSFVVHWQGQAYPAFTPLHGRAALSNILAAFTMACAIGADPEYLIALIRTLTPVSNRLEVVADRGYVQINDAYNSNPQGFLDALEVLKKLPGRRRILVTPGMIELGAEQEHENFVVARAAADVCDRALIVGKVNRSALLKGLQEGGLARDKVAIFDSRNAALTELFKIREEGDVVLIENDLPDLFEINLRF